MQPVRAATGEVQEQTQAPGVQGPSDWATRQVGVELTFKVSQFRAVSSRGLLGDREQELSKCAPDLHLPTQNYAIHLQAIFKLKCCQRAVTVLIFLFCSFPIHPPFLVALER